MQISFGYIDIIFIVIIVAAIIRCMIKGFVSEFLSMAAIVIGILMAVLFSKQAALLLDEWFGPVVWNPIITFLVIFLIVYVIIKILQNALHSFFEKLHLDKLDRVLGFFFGIVEGILGIAVIIFVMNWLTRIEFLNTEALLSKSFFAGLLLPIIQPVTESLTQR